MTDGYFHAVARETPTRVWVNNPTAGEIEPAIKAGAINMTSNPSYASSLLKNERGYIQSIIDEVVQQTADDDEAAYRVNEQIVARAARMFLPLYERSEGKQGWVTIQGDPRRDDDADVIVGEAMRYRRQGENIMTKIPVTKSGMKAMERLIPENVAVCATEVFSIAQAVRICELYDRATGACGKKSPMYVTHITGIFDEYLTDVVKQNHEQVRPDILEQAGCIVGRKQYRLLKERGYPVTMLGGGARGNRHFTEFVGGDMHITINWSTARSLLEENNPVLSRINAVPPEGAVDGLLKLPDFRKAYEEDGLKVEEFAEYGPVQLFRSMFLKGYNHLLSEIRVRRTGERKDGQRKK